MVRVYLRELGFDPRSAYQDGRRLTPEMRLEKKRAAVRNWQNKERLKKIEAGTYRPRGRPPKREVA